MRSNNTLKTKKRPVNACKLRPGLSRIPGWSEIRDRIYSRDNDTCQACKGTGRLEVHHKDGDRSNNADENLITLCVSCHSRVHATGKKGNKRSSPKRPNVRGGYLVKDILSGKLRMY